MSEETLEKAIKLKEQIDRLTALVRSTEIQKCEWISFTHGNGSDKVSVSENKEDIEFVRSFLVTQNKRRLNELKNELESL